LCLFAGFWLSFGGPLIRSFEAAGPWQILFWRSLFFLLALVTFLILTYKKEAFNIIKKAGFPGILGGFFLSTSFVGYIFSITETTIANVVFIISSQTLFLAVFGYFFLKEKISLRSFMAIILAVSGVILMVGDSVSSGSLIGNLAALLIPINFSILIIIIRKHPNLDMVPAIFYSGILSAIYGFILSDSLIISQKDLGLSFLLGVPQLAFGFIFVTIGSRTTPAATVGLLMLTESIFAPIWGWLFFNEIPPTSVFIAGGMIITAVIIRSLEKTKPATG
jgi:drug/metabolite transporter (DMT)-like permease